MYRSLELDMRNIVAREMQRGKADLIVSVETLVGADAQVKLNVGAMAAYKAQIEAASAQLGIPEPSDWYAVLMRFPDVVTSANDEDVSEDSRAQILELTAKAVEGLMAHRRAEGIRLEEFFAPRIQAITNLLKDIEPFEAERVPKIRARIEEGLSKIPVAEYDKGRLEQEMIFYIEKLDVNEERQRLAQHLRYFIETMEGPAGQGKKLGFIAQEMGREINTLGSKSNHAEMQRIVVKMKDILEQIKEQVLNVM
jgi:uncharacterized protein (TIGR00255 family)